MPDPSNAARLPVKVWDPLVRVLHWTLAATIALAWLTRSGGGRWHEWIGYASLTAVAVRFGWGLASLRPGRDGAGSASSGWSGSSGSFAAFGSFVRAPAATLGYARALIAGREYRYVGHNPLGGWMIVALLTTAALAGFSGWLYTTDAWWGDPRVEAIHYALSVVLLVLIALHVAGVVVTSLRHRENLLAAMITGRKRPASGDDIG